MKANPRKLTIYNREARYVAEAVSLAIMNSELEMSESERHLDDLIKTSKENLLWLYNFKHSWVGASIQACKEEGYFDKLKLQKRLEQDIANTESQTSLLYRRLELYRSIYEKFWKYATEELPNSKSYTISRHIRHLCSTLKPIEDT
jgi:hypothetical protein